MFISAIKISSKLTITSFKLQIINQDYFIIFFKSTNFCSFDLKNYLIKTFLLLNNLNFVTLFVQLFTYSTYRVIFLSPDGNYLS